MKVHRTLRAPLAIAGALLTLMVAAPAALAHHVDTTSSYADCYGVQVKLRGFEDENHPVTYTLKVDGTVVAEGTLEYFTGDEHFDIPYPTELSAGTHEIEFVAEWPHQNGMNGTFTATVTCEGPPAPPETPPTTPPTTTPPETPPTETTPPATTPPETTPPATTPASVPPATTPSAGGVLPETVLSGRARLRGPSGCVRQAFTARVTGRSMARVTFYVNGKMVKRFRGGRSSYSIKVNPQRYGIGRHRIVAAVTFVAESGTRAQRLPLTFRRCARGAVAPRFTG